MLFTFTGSTHTKYATYLLEFITNFELESSKELHETVMNAMVVNLSGKEGGFAAGDIIQEFFNRLLKAIIERKGAQFGEPFVREVISRNLHHMGRVKTDLRSSIGLSAHAGRHSNPHTRPEVKTLLTLYAHHELHRQRPGRSIDDDEVPDDFTRGWEKLAKGKVRKWVLDMTRTRRMQARALPSETKSEDSEDSDDTDCMDEESDDEVDEDANALTTASTFGSMSFVDDEFIIETLDTEDLMRNIMDELDIEGDEEGSDAGLDDDHDLEGNEVCERESLFICSTINNLNFTCSREWL